MMSAVMHVFTERSTGLVYQAFLHHLIAKVAVPVCINAVNSSAAESISAAVDSYFHPILKLLFQFLGCVFLTVASRLLTMDCSGWQLIEGFGNLPYLIIPYNINSGRSPKIGIGVCISVRMGFSRCLVKPK